MKRYMRMFFCAGILLQIVIAQHALAADRLHANQTLYPNESLTSASGQYQLVMQGDGNLVLYNLANGAAEWASDTYGHPGLHAVMQGDGNLVLYDEYDYVQWNSGTQGTYSAELTLQDDGNLVIYGLAPVWATNTAIGDCGTNLNLGGRAALQAWGNTGLPPYAYPLALGQGQDGLRVGQRLNSSSGCYSLVMQSDRNLVLYRNTDGYALWSTGTSNGVTTSTATVELQADGNFVLYNSGAVGSGPATGCCGVPWASNTANGYGKFLLLQNDGNLVLYTGRVAIWAKGQRSSWGTVQPDCHGIWYNSITGWHFNCDLWD